MAEAKHPKNWKELGQSNPMRDIFVEKLVRVLRLRPLVLFYVSLSFTAARSSAFLAFPS